MDFDHGDTMNNQKPLTIKDLQIPCDYGVYEYRAPFRRGIPVRLLYRVVENNQPKIFVSIEGWDRTEYFYSLDDEDISKSIFKILPETTKNTP